MGLRFRKAVSLGKGVRLNFSKSGVSTSVGPRGASVSFGKIGTYANIGIPGTGISYRKRLDSRSGYPSQSAGTKRSIAQQIADYTGNPSFIYALAIDDKGKVFIVDEFGRKINDANLIALIKKDPEYREKKKCIEAQYCQALKTKGEILDGILDSLLHIHESSPRIKSREDYEQSISALRPKDGSPESLDYFKRKRRRLQAALDGTPSFIEWKTEKWLEVCELPIQIDASFEYSPSRRTLKADLNLPEIDAIPSTCIESLASGALKERNKPKKRINEEYELLISSLMVFTASSLFNISLEIRHVVLSGYTDRRDKSGALNPEYILSVDFERQRMAVMDYQHISPKVAISQFDNRQRVLSSGHMIAIEPL